MSVDLTHTAARQETSEPDSVPTVGGGVLEWFDALWTQAREIWLAGGWAMFALAAIAMFMFGVGIRVHLSLRRTGFHSVPERVWRRWIDQPDERRGPVGGILDFVSGGTSLRETADLFRQLRRSETIPFQRDLRMMKVCVSAAPLVGLLGTVTGMLATFSALSSGSGGEKTMALVAKGISEALITTETGLVIALPGLFIQYQLARRHERYRAFLAHLETVYTQLSYRRKRDDEQVIVQRAAQIEVAKLLRERLREQQIQDLALAAAGSSSRPPFETA